jgi:hypothetical protein
VLEGIGKFANILIPHPPTLLMEVKVNVSVPISYQFLVSQEQPSWNSLDIIPSHLSHSLPVRLDDDALLPCLLSKVDDDDLAVQLDLTDKVVRESCERLWGCSFEDWWWLESPGRLTPEYWDCRWTSVRGFHEGRCEDSLDPLVWTKLATCTTPSLSARTTHSLSTKLATAPSTFVPRR